MIRLFSSKKDAEDAAAEINMKMGYPKAATDRHGTPHPTVKTTCWSTVTKHIDNDEYYIFEPTETKNKPAMSKGVVQPYSIDLIKSKKIIMIER